MTTDIGFAGNQKRGGLFVGVGGLLCLLGLLSVLSPLATGLTIVIMLGALLVLAGVSQAALHLLAHERIAIRLAGLIIAGLAAVVGGWMIARPMQWLDLMTYVLLAYFIVSGWMIVMLGLRLRPLQGWGWALASGLLNVVLGAILWAGLPGSGLWFVGTLVGIQLIITGAPILSLGLALRRAAPSAIPAA